MCLTRWSSPENCRTYTKMKLRPIRSQWYLKLLERRFGRLPTGGLKLRLGSPPRFLARLRTAFKSTSLLPKFSKYALLLLGNKSPLSFTLNLIKTALDLKLKCFKLSAEWGSIYRRKSSFQTAFDGLPITLSSLPAPRSTYKHPHVAGKATCRSRPIGRNFLVGFLEKPATLTPNDGL